MLLPTAQILFTALIMGISCGLTIIMQPFIATLAIRLHWALATINNYKTANLYIFDVVSAVIQARYMQIGMSMLSHFRRFLCSAHPA